MNLSLLLPSALAALLAVALPLLIHLSRRSEQTLTEFAALRWLRAKLRPRRKLLFQEPLLLALRILLLIALALFLSRPVLLRQLRPEQWIVVVPGADYRADENLPTGKNVRWHWLVPGFPALEKTPGRAPLPISSLLRELDAVLPVNARLTVLAPSQLSGLDAERTQLSRAVDWRVVPGKMPSQASNGKPAPIKLAVRFDAGHAASVRYFQASHAAWQSQRPQVAREALDSAPYQSALPKQDRVLVWLVAGELPKNIQQWIAAGGTVLLSADSTMPDASGRQRIWNDSDWRSAHGDVIASSASVGYGRVLKLQQALTPQAMPALLEADFPERLQALLQTPPKAPSQSLASLHKPIKSLPAWPEPPIAINTWLALVITLLFLLERLMASAKHRWLTS